MIINLLHVTPDMLPHLTEEAQKELSILQGRWGQSYRWAAIWAATHEGKLLFLTGLTKAGLFADNAEAWLLKGRGFVAHKYTACKALKQIHLIEQQFESDIWAKAANDTDRRFADSYGVKVVGG